MLSYLLIVAFQFFRSFPGPADITPSEVATLAQRYYDSTTGLYNYLQFHNDILKIGTEGVEVTCLTTPPTSLPVCVRKGGMGGEEDRGKGVYRNK